jgi:pimeloyl-ACP methyl ester carboxylesterase
VRHWTGSLSPEVTSEQQAREVAQRCTELRWSAGAGQFRHQRRRARLGRTARATLGDEKLSCLGYSYRTELGATYAPQAFPQNVRAMVLDGAIDPELTAAEFRLSQFTGFQKAFTAMATTCASAPGARWVPTQLGRPKRSRPSCAPCGTTPRPPLTVAVSPTTTLSSA